MPRWHPHNPQGKDEGMVRLSKAQEIVHVIGSMQGVARAHLKMHRRIACGAKRWFEERESARPWLRLLLRAWLHTAHNTQARDGGNSSHEERAPMSKRKLRFVKEQQRLSFGVRRLHMYAQLVVKPDAQALKEELQAKKGGCSTTAAARCCSCSMADGTRMDTGCSVAASWYWLWQQEANQAVHTDEHTAHHCCRVKEERDDQSATAGCTGERRASSEPQRASEQAAGRQRDGPVASCARQKTGCRGSRADTL